MILYIGNFLSKHGYNPTICELLAPKLRNRYNIITASDKRNIISRFLDMIFTFLFNKDKIKLVIIDTYSTKAFWYAYYMALLSKLFKVKYIPIIHGGYFEKRLKKSSRKTFFFLSNAFSIVAPSTFMRGVMQNHNFQNVWQIPNFIPLEKYIFKPRKLIQPKLLWIRSFHKIYNPFLAIQIVEILVEKGYSPVLCMIGPSKDDSLRKIKNTIKDRNLTAYVKITGKLEKEDLIAASAEYDIFINTTNVDTFPLSIVEAMALGLPVISTDVGGISFEIENNINGLLVEPNNAEAFVEKIEILLKYKKLSKDLALEARKTAEKVDWNVIKDQWNHLIDNAIKS